MMWLKMTSMRMGVRKFKFSESSPFILLSLGAIAQKLFKSLFSLSPRVGALVPLLILMATSVTIKEGSHYGRGRRTPAPALHEAHQVKPFICLLAGPLLSLHAHY